VSAAFNWPLLAPAFSEALALTRGGT